MVQQIHDPPPADSLKHLTQQTGFGAQSVDLAIPDQPIRQAPTAAAIQKAYTTSLRKCME